MSDKPKAFTVSVPEADAFQFVCFIHGAQSGARCPKCPQGVTMSSTAGSLVEIYLSSRIFAIGAMQDALREFENHNDRNAFRFLDKAAPYVLTLKQTLVNESILEQQP